MKTVRELFGVGSVTSDREVGVEIEMEGTNLPKTVRHWKAHPDGSLRGESLEYVMEQPQHRDAVRHSIGFLEEAFEKNKSVLNPSERCGVHVHVNCQDLNFDQLMTYITLFLIVEDVLVNWCGEDREGNMFCLRSQDAMTLLCALTQAKRAGSLKSMMRDTYRYSAMNVSSLAKYGSIEFRSMRTPKKMLAIRRWVRMLLCVKDKSITYKDGREILEDYNRLGPIAFADKVFGKYMEYLKTEKLEQFLSDGVDRARDLIFTDKKKESIVERPSRYYAYTGEDLGLITIDSWEQGDYIQWYSGRGVRQGIYTWGDAGGWIRERGAIPNITLFPGYDPAVVISYMENNELVIVQTTQIPTTPVPEVPEGLSATELVRRTTELFQRTRAEEGLRQTTTPATDWTAIYRDLVRNMDNTGGGNGDNQPT